MNKHGQKMVVQSPSQCISHYRVCPCTFCLEFVNILVTKEQKKNHQNFVNPEDPFHRLYMNENGEEMIREYNISYANFGRIPYSEELFLAMTISLWPGSFVFPNSEGNKIRVEIFPRVCK